MTTEWVSYPRVFNAHCDNYLQIGVADDDAAPFTACELQREAPQAQLHWANLLLTFADLIRILEIQAGTR